MQRLFVVMFAVLVFLSITAASAGDNAAALATQIAGVAVAVLTIVSPLILKAIPAAGNYMVAITYVLSLVIAVVAGLLTGFVHAVDFTSTSTAIGASLAIYGLMQLVYNLLNQSKPKLVH